MITESQGQEVYAKLKQINKYAKELGINILSLTVNADFIDKNNCFTVNDKIFAN